jgi:hypothetical protein
VAEAISGIAVEHAEVGDNLEGRDDAHFDRQHQRHEDHPEEEVAQWISEVDDGKRTDDRDRDLADGDDQGHHQAVEHHRRHRRGRSPCRTGTKHLRVVDPELVAWQQPHRHLLHLFEGEGRGDEGHVERKCDDDDAQYQAQVSQECQQRAALDHQ